MHARHTRSGRSGPMNSATAAVPMDIPTSTTITPGRPRAPLGLAAPSGGGDAGCGAALLGETGLRWDGWWGGKGAADLLDDALQVVHVLGDPAGHLGVVAAASLGGAHRHAGREQVLDDVVRPVPFRFRLSRRVSWLWFCRAWPSPAWPSDPCKKGRSARCVSVRESCGRAAVRTLPWCRGRVALDEQRPGHRRLDPMSGCLTCRIGRHGFDRTSRHRPGTEPNGLGRSPDVPDRVAQVLDRGPDGGWW